MADPEQGEQGEQGEREPLLAKPAEVSPPRASRPSVAGYGIGRGVQEPVSFPFRPSSQAALSPTPQERAAAAMNRPEGRISGLLHRIQTRRSSSSTNKDQTFLFDSGSYFTPDLSEWSTLLRITGSVWSRRSTWIVALKMAGISIVVGAIVLIFRYLKPHTSDVKKFANLSTFFNGFVALLIGFFISSSMTRWFQCADGFLEFIDAIRCLQLQLFALGVPDEKIRQVLRYGVISGWLLHMELHIEVRRDGKQEAMERMWNHLVDGDTTDEVYGRVLPEEQEALKDVGDPSSTILVWVVAILGNMSMDGEIPPMASPTYGRIMNLVQDAHTSIRHVRSAISIQPPYIYVQMLATLVHTNNIINAIAFGILMGSKICDHMRSTIKHLAFDGEVKDQSSWPSFVVVFFLSFFGPFIYHALLEVSIAISRPFSSAEGEVPVFRLLRFLEHDLHDADHIRTKLPGPWKQPVFKTPPKPPAPGGPSSAPAGPAAPPLTSAAPMVEPPEAPGRPDAPSPA